MIVKLLSYCKKWQSYDTFNLLGVENEAEKTDVEALHHSFERSTPLVYNDSECNFSRYTVCAAKQHLEVCFYVKNENLYFHNNILISIENVLTRNHAHLANHLSHIIIMLHEFSWNIYNFSATVLWCLSTTQSCTRNGNIIYTVCFHYRVDLNIMQSIIAHEIWQNSCDVHIYGYLDSYTNTNTNTNLLGYETNNLELSKRRTAKFKLILEYESMRVCLRKHWHQRCVPSSLLILLIIRLRGSIYFCSCFHLSRYACSSVVAGVPPPLRRAPIAGLPTDAGFTTT